VNIALRRLHLDVPVGRTPLSFGAPWLAVLPLTLWAVHAIYVPLLGASLDRRAAWAAALTIVACTVAGLVAHAGAHLLAARALRTPLPPRLPVAPLGDAAQVWPPGDRPAAEAVVAASGIAASLLVAAIAGGVWLADAGTFATVVSFFLLCINAALAVVNLAPGFPFDGGRLVRALARSGGETTAAATTLAYRLGLALLAGLVAWAAFLASQRARFSTETCSATLALAGLAAVALFAHAAARPAAETSPPPARTTARRLTSSVLLTIVALVLVGASALPLPTNAGMEAPGSAASIESMVHVPPGHAHPVAGTLMLTTVIPQAPIVVAEWLYAQFDPAIHLTTSRAIVPAHTTPQQLAIRGFRDLQESEKTAIVVGLQLAGFDASLRFEGAEIVAIDPASRAAALLRPGDEIVRVNGTAVGTASDVSRILAADPRAGTARLDLKRGGEALSVDVPLTPPPGGTGAPKIGIAVSPTGDTLSLPFPVTITPQKVDGGPSAGLMFSLAVYNAVTADDLTRGHRIAGTGTIDLNGNVGTIGGVQQKVAAAERAGAEYFLSPPGNYADAAAIAGRIHVVRVATAREALAFLQGLPPLAP
jgi:PDZ domain-containing protein